MTQPPTRTGVQLEGQASGTSFLHRLLLDASAHFPDVLAPGLVPAEPAAFKPRFGDVVASVEAARIASPRRVEIARHLVAATRAAMTVDGVPLAEALQALPPTARVEERGEPGHGWPLELPLDGVIHRGRDVRRAVDRLLEDHHLTRAAHHALCWTIDQLASDRLELHGHRFVIIGAAAELSPAPILLAAGATVRWIDLNPPPAELPGRVVLTPGGDDVLGAPREVAAAIHRFAEEGGPVHLGLLAYAPGGGRELRLASAMNIIATAARPSIRSVSMYVSPTSPGELQPEDLEEMTDRAARPAWWQRLGQLGGALKAPGHVGGVARGCISLQGAAYQAAQYVSKILAAEVMAVDGLAGERVTVSANVAGITRTRSLSHPLFQLAFAGAPSFGVRIFSPATTRVLSALLLVHDLLNPAAPGAAGNADPSRARLLHAQQIHGGAYVVPWQFESAVRLAAVVGLTGRKAGPERRAD